MRGPLYRVALLATALRGVSAEWNPVSQQSPNENICKCIKLIGQCLEPSCVTLAADILASVDSSADPCKSFYSFANGKWLDEHDIPAGENEYGLMSSVRVEQNQRIVRRALEKGVEGKLGDMWTSCMNTTRIDEVGIEPMRILVDEIVNIFQDDRPKREQITDLLIWLHQHGTSAFFSIETDRDLLDANRQVVVIDVARAGVRKNAYRDAHSVEVYSQVISSVLRELGIPQDEASDRLSYSGGNSASWTQRFLGSSKADDSLANRVLSFEQDLQDAGPLVANEPALATYHPVSLANLSSMLPDVNVARYIATLQSSASNSNQDLSNASGASIDTVIVRYPDYIRTLSSLLERQSLATILAYSVLRTALTFASALGECEVSRQARMLSNLNLGITTPPPLLRSMTCLNVVDRTMGHWAGAVFVNATWNDETMNEVRDIFEDLRTSLTERFTHVPWMSTAARAAAARKARNMKPLIGYPLSPGITITGLENWYAGLEVVSSDFFGNVVRSARTEVARTWARLGQVTDPREWNVGMPVYAHTVNAAYTGPSNEIVLPAGILLPVWYDPGWPDAAKYGAIGGLIGHEITHGFDGEGRKFDEDGKLRDWWDNETVKAYTERAECFAHQYSGFWYLNEQGDREYINGTVTNAQDIADSGVANAWSTWRARAATTTAERNGQSALGGVESDEDAPLPGLEYSSEELFWISFARTWTALQSPAAARNTVMNGQSTNRWRVDGTLMNIRAFQDTWGCSVGEGMRPRNDDDVCMLW